jgi:uncharacterized membrane protein YdfJ with MMPL/SSD domain
MAKQPLNVYKHYVPSASVAIAFTVIFGALTLAHAVLVTLRKRYFPIIIIVGGVCKLRSPKRNR